MKEAPEILGGPARPGPIMTTTVRVSVHHHLLSPPYQLSYLFTLALFFLLGRTWVVVGTDLGRESVSNKRYYSSPVLDYS